MYLKTIQRDLAVFQCNLWKDVDNSHFTSMYTQTSTTAIYCFRGHVLPKGIIIFRTFQLEKWLKGRTNYVKNVEKNNIGN